MWASQLVRFLLTLLGIFFNPREMNLVEILNMANRAILKQNKRCRDVQGSGIYKWLLNPSLKLQAKRDGPTLSIRQ